MYKSEKTVLRALSTKIVCCCGGIFTWESNGAKCKLRKQLMLRLRLTTHSSRRFLFRAFLLDCWYLLFKLTTSIHFLIKTNGSLNVFLITSCIKFKQKLPPHIWWASFRCKISRMDFDMLLFSFSSTKSFHNGTEKWRWINCSQNNRFIYDFLFCFALRNVNKCRIMNAAFLHTLNDNIQNRIGKICLKFVAFVVRFVSSNPLVQSICLLFWNNICTKHLKYL